MSEIRATTISDLAGTGPATLTKQSANKCWINFNGTGTVAIRDSFNVSSLTDIGVGRYTITFTNAMDADLTYGITASTNYGVNDFYGGENLAGSFGTFATNYSGVSEDHQFYTFAVQGDLA